MSCNELPWDAQDWKGMHYHARKIQRRIALAAVAGDWHKVSELQKLVFHSWHCRMLAVHRVVCRSRIRTPGIDGKFWHTDAERYAAVEALKDWKDYQPKPFKRVYIPKDHDRTRTRPLSVPVIYDRAMQGLWLLAVDPVVEVLADAHSYGFRKNRSSNDVAKDINERLGFDRGNVWVLRTDVKECFDHLSHEWLLKHAPMNKRILRRILKCGYIYDGLYFPTPEGMPQGGVLSPVMTTLILSGFEQVLQDKYSESRVEMIRYVDDLLFSADNAAVLHDVLADLQEFLAVRGLEISEKKTFIRHISEGVDFIGWHVERDGNHLAWRPSEVAVSEMLHRVEGIISHAGKWTAKRLIAKLNGIVIGWGNYHAYLCTADAFIEVDSCLSDMLWKWALIRHPTHTASWIYHHYWHTVPGHTHKMFSSDEAVLLRFADVSVSTPEVLDVSKNPYIERQYFRGRKKEQYVQTYCEL